MNIITINSPITAVTDIAICDINADIVIAADLHSIAGSVYILGRTLLIQANATISTSNGNIIFASVQPGINYGTITANGYKCKLISSSESINYYPETLLSGRHIGPLASQHGCEEQPS